jgi:hypothetical protein
MMNWTRWKRSTPPIGEQEHQVKRAVLHINPAPIWALPLEPNAQHRVCRALGDDLVVARQDAGESGPCSPRSNADGTGQVGSHNLSGSLSELK